MNKTIGMTLAIALLLAGSAHAESGSSDSAELTSTVRSCVASAIATRESALASALSEKHTAVAEAYADRADALADAWSGTKTRAQIKADVKTAWGEFKSAVKSAQSEWKSDKKSAWGNFKSATKSCKAPSDTVDTSSASSEAI